MPNTDLVALQYEQLVVVSQIRPGPLRQRLGVEDVAWRAVENVVPDPILVRPRNPFENPLGAQSYEPMPSAKFVFLSQDLGPLKQGAFVRRLEPNHAEAARRRLPIEDVVRV